jgi:hypothetical protein
MDGSAALSLYRQEKERALQERRISHAQLMAEAKEAFAKMLADAQLARKGGRPKSNPGAAPVAPAAAAAKPKPVVVEAPVKKAVPVKVAERKVEPVVAKQKAAPAKKAGASKKVRVAAKRAQPARAKAATPAAKKSAKKAAPARAARPAARRKTAKKR